MAEGAVVPTFDENSDLKTLGLELESRTQKLRALEMQLVRKDGTLRHAREEHNLLHELHTVNQITKRKLDIDPNRKNKMLISQESLDRVIALEDQIKLEDKKFRDLQTEAMVVAGQLQKTEDSVAHYQGHVETIKDVTGWDRYHYASRGYVNAENLFREHQHVLSKSEHEQKMLKERTMILTQRIEELSAELEAKKTLDDDIAEARRIFKELEKQHEEATDDQRSLQRIAYRKEKLLTHISKDDDQKKVKMIEGDKRVLHAELIKVKEATKAKKKSIVAHDMKLRQLEAQLNTIYAFLSTVFLPSADDEGTLEKEVQLTKFNELLRELNGNRAKLVTQDGELDALDSHLEQLEKKYEILHMAAISRTAILAQEDQDKRRERAVINEKITSIDEDFYEERARLVDEQERLEQQLRRTGKQPQ